MVDFSLRYSVLFLKSFGGSVSFPAEVHEKKCELKIKSSSNPLRGYKTAVYLLFYNQMNKKVYIA